MVVFNEWFPIDKEFVINRSRFQMMSENPEEFGRQTLPSVVEAAQKITTKTDMTESNTMIDDHLLGISYNDDDFTKISAKPEKRERYEIEKAEVESILSMKHDFPEPFLNIPLESTAAAKKDKLSLQLSQTPKVNRKSTRLSVKINETVKKTVSLPTATPSKYQVRKVPKTTPSPSVMQMLQKSKEKRIKKSYNEVSIPLVKLKL